MRVDCDHAYAMMHMIVPYAGTIHRKMCRCVSDAQACIYASQTLMSTHVFNQHNLILFRADLNVMVCHAQKPADTFGDPRIADGLLHQVAAAHDEHS